MLISDQPILECFVRSTGSSVSQNTCDTSFVKLTLVVLPVTNILKVVYTSIVVVLTGENDVVEVAGMGIGDCVTVCVPSSEACRIVSALIR